MPVPVGQHASRERHLLTTRMKPSSRSMRSTFQRQQAASTFLLTACLLIAGPASVRAQNSPIRYLLDLRRPASHLVDVTMSVPKAAAGAEFRIPAWNNLYQIRDFVRDIQDVQAECNGNPTPLRRVDLETWESLKRCSNLEIHYSAYANQDNVFSAILDHRHAFLNFALLLFYLPHDRQRPVRVNFFLPKGWKLATMLDAGPAPGEYQEPNYDRLVDSPAEAGKFQQYDYVQKGATYRIVLDGNQNLYSARHLVSVVKRITAEETNLMHDVPFKSYTFMFFFSRHGGGGMEHWNGAAISIPVDGMSAGLSNLEGITAHEFFHLWNVKRIRPQGLQPIDYIRGNNTSDLWFSEGVTSTYSRIVLLRAGLIKKKQFYAHLALQIRELRSRPARHFQSVEESGRDAWLEKYADYFRPDRSISYYNKGELLGYLLDLGIRHATGNHRSLDNLMRLLNKDFAKRGRFFNDSDLERLIANLAPGFPCQEFFRDYIDGTRDLNYAKYLGYAGLELKAETATVPNLGFQSLQSFTGPVRVESVVPGSNAQDAGLQPGDILLKMDGVVLPVIPDRELIYFKPGQHVTFTVERQSKVLEIGFRLGAKNATVYKLEETQNPTPAQLELRTGWLEGKTAEAQAAGD